MAGLLVSTMDPADSAYGTVVQQAYELYLGWRQMAILSAASGSCQANFYCKVGSNSFPCLPHWKFSDQITSAWGTGAALDGDEDAILGLILIVYGTAFILDS